MRIRAQPKSRRSKIFNEEMKDEIDDEEKELFEDDDSSPSIDAPSKKKKRKRSDSQWTRSVDVDIFHVLGRVYTFKITPTFLPY